MGATLLIAFFSFVLTFPGISAASGVGDASRWQCWTLSDSGKEENKMYGNEIPQQSIPVPTQRGLEPICTAFLERYSLTQNKLGTHIIKNNVYYGSSCKQTFNVHQLSACCFDNVVYAGIFELGRKNRDLPNKGWICKFKWRRPPS